MSPSACMVGYVRSSCVAAPSTKFTARSDCAVGALVCSRGAGVLVLHAATRDARRTEFRAVVRTVAVHATTCAAPTGSRLTYLLV